MGGFDVQGQHCVSILNVGVVAEPVQEFNANATSRIVAIILAFICFLLLATFPGWHEETDERGSERDVKPFPSRPVSQIALALIFVASVFVLVSVLWQHTASVAASTIAQDLGNGSVKSGVGTTAMVLGWFGFALLIVVTIGLLVMILSISLLDRLTDE
jgi:multisubunit Na+/H+ antiporter MnhB subunit